MLLQYDREHIDRESVKLFNFLKLFRRNSCSSVASRSRNLSAIALNLIIIFQLQWTLAVILKAFQHVLYTNPIRRKIARCLSLTYRLVYNWERNKFACYCSLASEWVWNLYIMLLTIVVSTLRLSTTKNESNWTESYIFVNPLSTPFFCENWAISILASKRRC